MGKKQGYMRTYFTHTCTQNLLHNADTSQLLLNINNLVVEVWKKENCRGNMSCRGVFSQLLPLLLNFHKRFLNYT